MFKQSDKITALYYRAANKQTEYPHLDNQMTILLSYAKEQGIDSFALYADIGVSGLTLDRPAFNALKADIEAGRINKLIIRDIARIARNYTLMDNFIIWAQTQGVEIISVTDGVITSPPYADIFTICRSLPKGGGRA